MKTLIKKINLELVEKLLSSKKIVLDDLGKQENSEFEKDTQTFYFDIKDLNKEEVILLQKLDLIYEYLKHSWDPRSKVWILNPKKLQELEDLKFYHKVMKCLDIANGK